jgi:hypothetical protein
MLPKTISKLGSYIKNQGISTSAISIRSKLRVKSPTQVNLQSRNSLPDNGLLKIKQYLSIPIRDAVNPHIEVDLNRQNTDFIINYSSCCMKPPLPSVNCKTDEDLTPWDRVGSRCTMSPDQPEL